MRECGYMSCVVLVWFRRGIGREIYRCEKEALRMGMVHNCIYRIEWVAFMMSGSVFKWYRLTVRYCIGWLRMIGSGFR